MNNWNSRFINLAYHVATWSKDPSTKVGAVIVDHDNRIISVGYNGFPRGIEDRDLDDRELKYKKTIHAEINAICFAHQKLDGMTMYVTHPPCAQCAANIIQVGIAEVIVPLPEEEFMSRWGYEWDISIEMFGEAGVQLFYHHEE